MTRHELAERGRRLAEIDSFWRGQMRERILDLGRPGGGTARLTTQEEFDAWRAYLLPRHDTFREDVRSAPHHVITFVNDAVVSEGLEVLRQVVRVPSASGFIQWVIAGEARGMHGGTVRAAQLDATLERYRATLENADRALPGAARAKVQEVAATLDRGANWIEAHPATLRLATVLIGLALILLGIITVAQLAEIARLLRGAG